MTIERLDLLLFWLAIVLLVRALHDWFTATTRTRRHRFQILLTTGLVVLQLDAVLPLDLTWRTVKAIASLVIFVSAMWLGSNDEPTSDLRL